MIFKMTHLQENRVVRSTVSFETAFIRTLLKNESVLKDEIHSLAEELEKTKKELQEAKDNVASERAMNQIQFNAYVDELMIAENKIEALETALKNKK